VGQLHDVTDTTTDEEDYDTTIDEEEDSTEDEEDVEEDAPVQPVQAKGIGRVRKMVLGGVGKKERVVSSGGAVVLGGVGKSGVAGGVASGGVGNTPPKKVTKQPKATPPNAPSPTPPVTSSGVPPTPPKQFKVVPKPLVEQDRKPKPKFKEPDVKEVITPA
jgi:hypothetical protein